MPSALAPSTRRLSKVRFPPPPKRTSCAPGSPPRHRWDASVARRKSRPLYCSLHPRTAASSQVSICSSTVASHRCECSTSPLEIGRSDVTSANAGALRRRLIKYDLAEMLRPGQFELVDDAIELVTR